MLQCLLKHHCKVAGLPAVIHIHSSVFFPSTVTAESVNIQWSSSFSVNGCLAERGVDFYSLLAPPTAHVAPVAAPLSPSVSPHTHTRTIDDNKTQPLLSLCHVIITSTELVTFPPPPFIDT